MVLAVGPSRNASAFGRSVAGVIAAALLAIPFAASGAEARVLASLVQPPGGLACGDAAGQAKVVFDFREPRPDIKQISVFVNGKGVPKDAVAEEWPRLTVLRGLQPGRNTVEVYATGADDKAVAHKLTVLVGETPRSGETGSAIVDCVGGAAGQAQVAESTEIVEEAPTEVVEDVTPVIEDDVEYVERRVYVDDYYEPVYVYHPYPVFSFVAFEPVFWYPYPAYRYQPYRSSYYGARGNVWANAHDSRWHRDDNWDHGSRNHWRDRGDWSQQPERQATPRWHGSGYGNQARSEQGRGGSVWRGGQAQGERAAPAWHGGAQTRGGFAAPQSQPQPQRSEFQQRSGGNAWRGGQSRESTQAQGGHREFLGGSGHDRRQR